MNNTLRKTLNFFIFIGITVFIAWFLRYDIYEYDDFFQSFFYTPDWWKLIKTADHGRYFSWIYMKSIVHGTSFLLNIHPNDNIIPKIFVGINIAFLSLLIARFATKPFGKKLSPLWFTATFLILLNIYTISMQQIYRYNQHFAYQSNLIFFFWAWSVISTYIIKGELPRQKDLLKNCFLTFMLGVTAHFNTLSSIGGILFLFFAYFIYSGIATKWNIKVIFTFYSRLGKGVGIPLLFFIIGNILYFMAPSFQLLNQVRSDHDDTNRILHALSLLPEFLPRWVYNVFIKDIAVLFSLGIFITIVFITISMLKYKINKNNAIIQIDFSTDSFNKKVRVIISTLALIIGVSFFMGTLIYAGKSCNYYGPNQFWLVHGDLQVLTRMIFLSSLWILVGYLSTLTPKLQKSIPLGILIYSILQMFLSLPHYTNLYSTLKTARTGWYQTEKIYRLYSLKQQTAILPAQPTETGYAHPQLGYQNPDISIDWTGEAYIRVNYPTIYYNHPFQDTSPYKDHFVSYTLTNSNIALSLFHEKGGTFTEEELENPKFSKLFDPNFITNTQ